MPSSDSLTLQPVIMAGGSGTRLWPASRELYPKQFLPLLGEESMLQQTVRRLEGLRHATPLFVCNEEHRFLAAEQLRQCGLESAPLLLEPEGRNTAPAIALAALHATRNGDDPLLFVLPADHAMEDTAAFHRAVDDAAALAAEGHLVTFGVVPTSAETGYGYIKQGAPLPAGGYAVRRFVEKPDAATAQHYVDDGGYLWNSGMFLFRASTYLAELDRFEPDVLNACRQALPQTSTDAATDTLYPFLRIDADAFCQSPGISVDYALMERTEHAAVVPLDAGWSDVGSWSALWAISEQDHEGNVARGDILTEGVQNSFMEAEDTLLTCLGVENLVIVATKDAVLVADRHRVQDVRNLVHELKRQGRTEHINHRVVYRPWGCYESIDTGHRYQVKRITVNPGARLSKQLHHHRAEHWVVVKGTAQVEKGEREYLVTENESTFIPVGQVHSLENPGSIPLELIEVQSGSYLGEDDILRISDLYGRKE
ncbi:mannose-1-phosphate guanylyltransferase/mannose-6-phosphate isomerase [Halorhodospira halophila]|uniref:mannose-1-phosphate guanylyltransferase/mannose-6-phosphate isomerase n=1 Tax=Halorhodospira halophila TaxID=1053 RepID=UPI001913FFC6|nr:mannose-1-phosphate guanylyltransferase/mannose-6-phosphate isomerase [Halorhodospira halophila]MBK5944770.1 mannose-1-phosphate guanylyltransferase/mannose-6-phosphate isomerase [Halorhodospira halophila]